MGYLRNKADEVINIINEIPIVKKCTIYGSLANNTYDDLSDIDIEIDVSGYDNGKFMLELVDLIKNKLSIYYVDYAPSLIPDRYIVSLAIDESNPFLILDLCCNAKPYCTTVTKKYVATHNTKVTHILKLWTANLKHYVRREACYEDIVRMAKKIGIKSLECKDETGLLYETLHWLESNVESNLNTFVKSCRQKFVELMN